MGLYIINMELVLLFLSACLLSAQAVPELPKFSQMLLLYPGYYLHGGRYRDKDIIQIIGGHFTSHTHNTASLRLSWLLNRCGGIHAIGSARIDLSKHGNDSYTGKDGQEYIFRNTAFGPYLAAKYGNPLVAKPNFEDHTKTMDPFKGKKGIVRLVSYQRSHASGHVALWECDHFVQSRDWTIEKNMISVEFWETPDSYCPQSKSSSTHAPYLQRVSFSPALLAKQLQQQELLHRQNQKNHPHHRRREEYVIHTRHQRHHQTYRRHHGVHTQSGEHGRQ